MLNLQQAFALTQDQLNSITENTPFYDPDASDASCGSGSSASATPTTLVGSDGEQQAYNFFASKGLSAIQDSAVLGNFQDESHFNPEIMQKNGLDSQNPVDADPLGWGLAQWTPGSKIIGIAAGYHVSTPIYELATQLNIVWDEMMGTSPAGYENVIGAIEKINDGTPAATLAEDTTFFQVNFESGDPGARQADATAAYSQYGKTTAPADPTSTGQTSTNTTCASLTSSTSPDCSSAIGDAKILCDAERYNTVSYDEAISAGHQGGAAWHATCPIIGPGCYLDCSGLVNIAVYDVFGVDLRENTYSEATDTTDWQHLSSLSQVEPGDLIQPAAYAGGHVEIIDHVVGNMIYTFGAHTDNVPQPDQVGPAGFTASPGDLYLHYIGPENGAGAATSSD